jgi:hypothetical protein
MAASPFATKETLAMTKDSNDIATGLQQLFKAQPELFDGVREIVEKVHHFLYDANGGDIDACITVWNERIPEILEAAQTIPSLRGWVAQLDDFKENEHEAVLRSAAV